MCLPLLLIPLPYLGEPAAFGTLASGFICAVVHRLHRPPHSDAIAFTFNDGLWLSTIERDGFQIIRVWRSGVGYECDLVHGFLHGFQRGMMPLSAQTASNASI